MSTVLYDAPGPKGKRRILIWSIIAAAAIIGLVVFVLLQLNSRDQLDGDRWAVLLRPDLLLLFGNGLLATLQVMLFATVFSLVGGGLLAVARLSHRGWLNRPSRVIIEVFRGLPPLLLVFFLFLGGPAIGILVPAFWALVLGITLYNSAVLAEVFRAGVLTLPKGQTEASYAVGLTRGQTLQLVLLPQAVRHMLPAIVSQLVIILKESSLGFIVGYLELARDGRTAIEFLGEAYSIPVYTGIAVIYITLGLLLSRLANWLSKSTERRLGRLSKEPTS